MTTKRVPRVGEIVHLAQTGAAHHAAIVVGRRDESVADLVVFPFPVREAVWMEDVPRGDPGELGMWHLQDECEV